MRQTDPNNLGFLHSEVAADRCVGILDDARRPATIRQPEALYLSLVLRTIVEKLLELRSLSIDINCRHLIQGDCSR